MKACSLCHKQYKSSFTSMDLERTAKQSARTSCNVSITVSMYTVGSVRGSEQCKSSKQSSNDKLLITTTDLVFTHMNATSKHVVGEERKEERMWRDREKKRVRERERERERGENILIIPTHDWNIIIVDCPLAAHNFCTFGTLYLIQSIHPTKRQGKAINRNQVLICQCFTDR